MRKKLTDTDGKFSNLLRLLIGYGIPTVIVSTTITVNYVTGEEEAYCQQELCWLSEDAFIYAFLVPAGLAMLFNFFVLIKSLRVVFEVQERRSASTADEVFANAKSCLILTFLLGLTWSLGFFITGPLAVYAAYAFVALNGSVGFFLFLHTVLLNESLAGEMKSRLGLSSRGTFRMTFSGGRSKMVRRESSYVRSSAAKGGGRRRKVTRKRSEFHSSTGTFGENSGYYRSH